MVFNHNSGCMPQESLGWENPPWSTVFSLLTSTKTGSYSTQKVSYYYDYYYMIVHMTNLPSAFSVLFACFQDNTTLIQLASSLDFVLNLAEKSELLQVVSLVAHPAICVMPICQDQKKFTYSPIAI